MWHALVIKSVYTLGDLRNWENVISLRQLPIRFGVLGDPVAHSLSPQMQNAALKQAKIYAQYARFEIRAAELKAALDLMRTLGFWGANLTVPHKVAALRFVDELDGSAARAGAINTLMFESDQMRGFNTDGVGISRAIAEEFSRGLREFRVLLLGAGGAARAIASQCLEEGVAHLGIWSRTHAAVYQLGKELAAREGNVSIEVIAPDRDALFVAAGNAELIINATPVGLRADDQPLLMREAFTKRHFVYDTVYQPSSTRLIEEAKAAGASTANGLSMLLHQGAEAFSLWTRRPAPLETMREALRRPSSS